MRYLLDTGVFLWAEGMSTRLNARARELLQDGREEIYLSAISSWEISIKCALQKLRLPESPASFVPKCMIAHGIRPLVITHAHALGAGELPQHHQDPFDRMLIAQAVSEKLVLMTADAAFERYDVETLWCGK